MCILNFLPGYSRTRFEYRRFGRRLSYNSISTRKSVSLSLLLSWPLSFLFSPFLSLRIGTEFVPLRYKEKTKYLRWDWSKFCVCAPGFKTNIYCFFVHQNKSAAKPGIYMRLSRFKSSNLFMPKVSFCDFDLYQLLRFIFPIISVC